MKILKSTDLVRISTTTEQPIHVTISPMTSAIKMDIASKTKIVKGEEVPDHQAQAAICVKHCIKKIEGVKNYDDSDYVPTFIDGVLDDNSVDDILSLLSDSALILPVILASNKNLSAIKDVEIAVNPKS